MGFLDFFKDEDEDEDVDETEEESGAEESRHDPLVGDLLKNAEALLEMDRYPEAIAVCDRALERQPQCAAALALKAYARGKSASTPEEVSAALGLIDEANRLDASDPRVRQVSEFFETTLDEAEGRD